MNLFPVILVLLAYYNCKVTNWLVQFDAQSKNHAVNSKTSKLEARRLFKAIGKRLISDFENKKINIGYKCSRKGECKPKGCKLRRTSSRSIAG